MIRFQRNGQENCTRVFAGIQSGLPTDTPLLWFSFDCENAEHAALLEMYLRKRLQNTIERAHQLAYERGWKDAKSKKARKATGFANYFTDAATAVAW